MNPNFVAALFISLNIAPVSPSDRFTIEWADCFLEIAIYRGSGSVERLVLMQTTSDNSFDFLEPFDPKTMDLESRNSLIQDLGDLGRKQCDIARLFQLSESSVFKILKQGK